MEILLFPYSQQPTTFISRGPINPLQALSSCFFKTYFSIILLCSLMSSKFSLSFRCPYQDAIGTFLLLRTCCICNSSSLYFTSFKPKSITLLPHHITTSCIFMVGSYNFLFVVRSSKVGSREFPSSNRCHILPCALRDLREQNTAAEVTAQTIANWEDC